jgi:hypothetical protein
LWRGVLTPISGASNDLIDIDGITSSRRSTLKEPAIKARFEPLGVTVAGSREKLAVKVKTDAELWGPLQQSVQHPGRVKSQTKQCTSASGSKADETAPICGVGFSPVISTGRRNTLSEREKINYRPISQ